MPDKVEPKLSKHCVGTLITKTPEILLDPQKFRKRLNEILDQEDVQCLGELIHQFENKSFTFVVGLAESHISLHTWPERHAVQLDVFLCNYMNDNTEKCQRIFDKIVEYFDPIETNETVIERL